MNKKDNKKQKAEPKPEADNRDPAVIRAEEIRGAGGRETVEAFVVAFILALLFRAFIAEAFVIPTGSMAPTLMGAHKDLTCDRCSMAFPVGASLERRGPEQTDSVVGGVCPNCRHVNALDLTNDKNHGTFNGDRILVSKFAYTLADPERWDVIVFKFPGNPKQNYIKRLVGLPNETLTILHGDVYARPTGSTEKDMILRKPPEKVLSMRHRVSDTDFQSKALIDANYPSRWQPWESGAEKPPEDSWKVDRADDSFVATLDSAAGSDTEQWLRYFHRWPSEDEWNIADKGLSLAKVDPYSCRLITDFYAYDSYIRVPAKVLYDEPPKYQSMVRRSRIGQLLNIVRGQYTSGVFNPNYKSGESLEQFGERAQYGGKSINGDGFHWVGDLIFEADVETSADSKFIKLMLVEAGIEYQCEIDLSNGQAKLLIDDVEPRKFTSNDGKSAEAPTGQTAIRAGSRQTIRFSNVDDQLTLWVDDSVVTFDGPTSFDARTFRNSDEHHPYYMKGNPMDGAPAGICVQGGKGTVRRLSVDRDKYYIATNNQGSLYDYDMSRLWELTGGGPVAIQQFMAKPETWNEFAGWQLRGKAEFALEEDQFFPMGDNSPESLDARCWARTKLGFGLPERISKDAYAFADAWYVPRDLLVGKALAVFWPHYWRSPIPFQPNFKRMKLIR